jgi:methylthioribose-1-phosphate isomerase
LVSRRAQPGSDHGRRLTALTEYLKPSRVVRLEDDAVVLLDQRRLPDEEAELRCRSAADVAEAIRTLAIRGAPAIGVAAAYGYALAATRGEDLDAAYAELASARPTAVNLAWALEEMRTDPTPERAREIHEAEVERCRRMAAHAAELLAARQRRASPDAPRGSEPRGVRVLTHCNTGALATGGHGTALGAIRTAWERGLVEHVWVGETRPLLQGGRLTAWELDALGIPFEIVADAAAASLMAAGLVDCVLAGADRIAANGDTANKIGTYGLAVAARQHDIPLYVVAPTSTLDAAAASGADISLEERDPAEVSSRFPARNPAFDVTPADLIAAIVTEHGVHRAPYVETLPQRVPA